jgi:hypothetical protein
MIATERIHLKAAGESTKGCDNDWCGGPESETLPYFECYDPTREYERRTGHDDSVEKRA